MGLNLCGVGVEFESQSTLHEGLGDAYPVEGGEGEVVCVVVANSAIELASDAYLLEVMDLIGQSIGKVGEFLAESGGGCGLSVSVRQHGMRCPCFALAD